MTLKPCEHFGGFGAELNFCLTAIFGGLSRQPAELSAELCELCPVHHIGFGKVSDDISEAGACALGDKLGYDAVLGLALATIARHKARFR